MSLQWSSLLTLVGLILLANGLPALLGLLMGTAKALDGGRTLADGRPLLGPSKTWRGLVAALVGTTLGGLALGLRWTLGLKVATGAMLGDLAASFIKRRLGYPASASVPLLDQIPEALLPTLLVKAERALAWPDVVLVTLAFVVADLGLTPLGRRLIRGRSGTGRA
jgi:CDP-2,3-bis-(O-geranylgeranyl)-sn-glycerol synthase